MVGDDFYNAIYAEFAYAGFFKPVKSQDTELLSGSTLWDVDIMSVVNKCKETYQDEDIVLDVLLTSQRTLPVIDAHGLTAVNMLWRYLEISSYYTAVDGLLRAKYAFPNITFRNIVSPSERLPSSIKPLQLDQPDIDSMIALGEKDGKASAAAGPQPIEDTFHYFSLVMQEDDSVDGVDFDRFVAMKSEGAFAEYDVLEDETMKAFFLQ